MNIFEFAMKMEQDGRAYYLENAEKTTVTELKKILVELAEDEQRHYDIIKALRDDQSTDFADFETSTILTTARNVFENLRAEEKDLSQKSGAKAIWEEARDVEKKAEEFYRGKAKEVSDERQKRVLNLIADEEHRHWLTMENVIQYLERPQQRLADAEWSYSEDE